MYPNNYGQLPAQALLGHTPPCGPCPPETDVSRVVTTCTVHNTHKHSAASHELHCSLSPARASKWWGLRTQSGAALAIIAGVRSEGKRGQNFHHKKKRHHCYENLRFNTRNVISRSPSQFFYSCVVCCWFRGSFYAFFHTKSLGLFITNQYDRYPFTIARWI